MELPVVEFIRERLREVDPEFETRPGSAFHELYIKPQQLMLQPLITTMDQVLVSQSVRRILAEPDPDSYSEEDVDDLGSNTFVTRNAGSFATTTVRVYYDSPRDIEYPAESAEFTAAGLSFFNVSDVVITASQMALQTDGTLFYFDTTVRAQAEGEAYNVAAGEITGFVNDLEAIRVTNLGAATGGLDRETNSQFLSRIPESIGVRDLETTKGINAILREKFPGISRIQSIGMGDAEMMRDILYNVHVGGKTDVYIKMPGLTTQSQDFVGLDYDTTRDISRQLHVQMARSSTDTVLSPDTGTPNIKVSSVQVREDIIEEAAEVESVVIPPTVGIDLTGAEWLRIQVDARPFVNVKVSGADVASTQLFEIINSINAAVGLNIASTAPGNRIRLRSPTVGAGSQLVFAATAPFTQAATALFGISVFPTTYEGLAAETYVENTDYVVDYADGLIYQADYLTRSLPTILSGQMMLSSVVDGQIVSSSGDFFLDSSVSSRFLQPGPPAVKVRVGDEVTIESIGGMTTGTVLGDLPRTFIVSEVVSTTRLRLVDFDPTGTTGMNDVAYSIKSNQVVIINYQYAPISIDIGGQVLLSDGFSRGVRPGRGPFTIEDAPFIDVVSVQEIDPDSGEEIGEPLIPARGYGSGGYGSGGYGNGDGGDYFVKVLNAVDRFSVFDDMVILFTPEALGKSYRVTYRWVPEIVPVHNISRDDTERVTGADVLPKSFVPALFDLNVVIRRDATNLNTPANEDLAELIGDLVGTKTGSDGVQASDISKLLEDQGVDSVRTPFTMRATVLNTDGTTLIIESQDILQFPDVILPRQTDNYVTKRIVHFFPNQISVTEES